MSRKKKLKAIMWNWYKLQKEQNKLHIEKIKAKNRLRMSELDDAYITRNKYKGKSKTHFGFIPKTFMILAVLFVLPILLTKLSIDIVILILVVEASLFAAMFITRIRITPEGIRYRNKSFRWDQIKTIGIGAKGNGMPREFCHKLIYISKKEHDKPLQLINGGRCKETQFYGCDRGLAIPKFMILASFNRRLLLNIIAYWGADIVNIENVKGWYQYIRLYNSLHRSNNTP